MEAAAGGRHDGSTHQVSTNTDDDNDFYSDDDDDGGDDDDRYDDYDEMMLRVDDTSDTRVHEIANTFLKFQRTFCFYHKKFLVAEMLNTFCVALSIYISHVLLNQQFIDYGHRVILDFNNSTNSSDSWYFVQTDIDICR